MQWRGVRRLSVRPSVCSLNFCTNRFFSHANGRIATKLAQDGLQVSLHPGCAQGQGQGQRSRDTRTFLDSWNELLRHWQSGPDNWLSSDLVRCTANLQKPGQSILAECAHSYESPIIRILCPIECVSLCQNKKLSYCWETVRRESMPRIAEMDVEMTT